MPRTADAATPAEGVAASATAGTAAPVAAGARTPLTEVSPPRVEATSSQRVAEHCVLRLRVGERWIEGLAQASFLLPLPAGERTAMMGLERSSLGRELP